jgi:hypothetical protein
MKHRLWLFWFKTFVISWVKYRPGDGGTILLQNLGSLLSGYTVL